MSDIPAKDPTQARYEYIAHQINREDGLVNYRISWTLQANGFLFAAMALVGKDVTGIVKLLFTWAVPLTGLFISLAGLLGVIAAHGQIKDLKKQYENGPYSEWPRPFGAPTNFFLGTLPAFVPLGVLAIVWLAAFIAPIVSSLEETASTSISGSDSSLWISGPVPKQLSLCTVSPAASAASSAKRVITCEAK